jgi:hypothetical protein
MGALDAGRFDLFCPDVYFGMTAGRSGFNSYLVNRVLP